MELSYTAWEDMDPDAYGSTKVFSVTKLTAFDEQNILLTLVSITVSTVNSGYELTVAIIMHRMRSTGIGIFVEKWAYCRSRLNAGGLGAARKWRHPIIRDV